MLACKFGLCASAWQSSLNAHFENVYEVIASKHPTRIRDASVLTSKFQQADEMGFSERGASPTTCSLCPVAGRWAGFFTVGSSAGFLQSSVHV